MTFAVTTLIPAKMPEDFVEKFGEFIQAMDPTSEGGRRKIIATDAFMRFLADRRKAENKAMQGLEKTWAKVRSDITPQLWDAIDHFGTESSTGGRQIKTSLGSINRASKPGKPGVVDEEKGIQFLGSRMVDETIIPSEMSEEIDTLVRLREKGLATISVKLTPAGKQLLEEEFVRGAKGTGVERSPDQRQTRISFRNDSQKAEARELMTTVLQEFFEFQEAACEEALEALDEDMLADFGRAIG